MPAGRRRRAGPRLPHLDTAQAYDNEADVGAAIAADDVPREELFVATKLDVFDFELTDAELPAVHRPSKLRTVRSILRGQGPF